MIFGHSVRRRPGTIPVSLPYLERHAMACPSERPHMTRGDPLATAVEQVFFRCAADAAPTVVASSLDGEEAERRWCALLAPHLGRNGPVPALRYLTFPGGFAAVLGRTGRASQDIHALLGLEADLTPVAAVTASTWPGWGMESPADAPLPRLRAADLKAPGAAEQMRATVLH